MTLSQFLETSVFWGKKDPDKTPANIFPQEVFRHNLSREKARADRNGHGFSLVVIDVSELAHITNLTDTLLQQLRPADEIGWFEQNQLGVLLYNMRSLDAWRFLYNHKKETGRSLSMRRCSVYSYPNEWCGKQSEAVPQKSDLVPSP